MSHKKKPKQKLKKPFPMEKKESKAAEMKEKK